ncbi:polypeptide N-acetylgalactosaminyltransferase [Elysia marginata]|uniref:Polypeptide N-acetylgalactosaminyltransferase n=1 Tax=Elysia marginata TaxID=1093978 RepID=A0AAV4G7C1_9GAST|nr:polypeptide N-acetylgalactosaminyltransferase [Elysia marginata]
MDDSAPGLKDGNAGFGGDDDDDEKDDVSWRDFDSEAYLSKQRLKPGQDAYARNKFNQQSSDDTKPDREVPDTRNHMCKSEHWSSDLPDTSVIITFHNEARSTLFRTIVSVFRMSPDHLIREIILVDDFSENASDGQELEIIKKVKILRNDKRQVVVVVVSVVVVVTAAVKLSVVVVVVSVLVVVAATLSVVVAAAAVVVTAV